MRVRAARELVALGLVVTLAAAVTLSAPARPATAAEPEQGCIAWDAVTKKCTKWIPLDGGPPAPGPGPSGPGPSGPSTNPYWPLDYCEWVSAGTADDWADWKPAGTPDDAVPMWNICYVNGQQIGIGIDALPAWVAPGTPPAPSPQQVAQGLRLSVEALLHAPTVVADPPVGEESILKTATFVAVTNWEGPVADDACVATVCVTLTAEPALTFDPGDGTDPIPCAGAGGTYQRGGPPPREQAEAEGACAHIYERRTSVAGRPAAWPGEVSISWDLRWSGAGQDGTFPAVTMGTPVPRAVEEMQTVVVEPGGG